MLRIAIHAIIRDWSLPATQRQHQASPIAVPRTLCEQLDMGKAPPLAPGTGSFVVEQRVEQPLADTIIAFNADLVKALWFTKPSGTWILGDWDIGRYLNDPELQDTLDYIGQLRSQGQTAIIDQR